MTDRRSFLKSLIAGGAALALSPAQLFALQRNTLAPYFGVHPFVELNPDAVFIMRTSVDVKTNSAAILQAGSTFGSSVFIPMSTPGIPISWRVAIKPNIVMMPVAGEQYMGIVTDPFFVEGVIQSLKSLGIGDGQFYLREVNDPSQFANSGYLQMAARTGADLRKLDDLVGIIPENELQWIDVPQGKWFKKIPFLWPVNAPDTWLLNIAKLKTHLMGMSLCAKNLQGAIARPYVAHCTAYKDSWDIEPEHVQPDAKAHIWDDYQRHLAAGIPRWDRPGEDGGVWQEIWAARCLDNNSVTHPGLHVIEAVYGREGPFLDGPGPDGKGVDHMVNVLIFGKNPFHVDNIGLWMGGHEPGNFGLLHIAIERGQASILNPHDIPLYEWFADSTHQSTSLDDFTRASLRTNYLQRNYYGQTEALWHLVNEPYSYTKILNKQIAVGNGWNMVSVPVAAADMSINSIFPGPPSQAYEFSGSYFPVTTLDTGKAYWLKFTASQSYPVTGSQISSRSVAVKAGWNMVGPFETDVAVTEITSTPAGILASKFFGYDQGYVAANTLVSGHGYWIKVTQDGVLQLPAGPAKPNVQGFEAASSFTRIQVTDAIGRTALLYLASDERSALNGTLPPIPPEGAFDARFIGDEWIQGPLERHELQLRCAQYPMTVRADNLKGRTLTLMGGPGVLHVNAQLKEGVPVAIDRDFGALVIEELEIPGNYELSQNYPNPFNPSTEIGFQIPETHHVKLTVFDARGAEVSVLVNERRDAGRYVVSFNGVGRASGVYIARLEAGNYVQTRKMVLLK